MMKRFMRVSMLLFLVTLLLSAWALPAAAASNITSTNGQVARSHFSHNASVNGSIAGSADPRGIGEFDAVAAVSANDVWAVGDGIGTLIEHWNGTRWSFVKSPSPGTDFNNLYGVVAVSTNNVWAVGSYSDNQQAPNVQTLIEHWNGSQWSVVSSPSPGTQSNQLNGIVAISANDIWAVGSYDFQTLTEHWNGSQWSVVSSPSPNNDAFLNGVTAISANNVWAVGYYFSSGSSRSSSGTGSQTLIEQWNGTNWSVIPGANSSSPYNDLSGVVAVPGNANDIWAVGTSNNGSQTLIEQWNGSSWNIVSSPNPGSLNNTLNAVVAVSASDVWAVGGEGSGTGSERTLIEQWNGTQWNVVTSPNAGTGINRLNGVTTISASDVWAVGVSVPGVPFQTLTEQWNGTQWSVVPSPDQIGIGNLSSVATVSANDIWAVGSDDSGTLTEQWNGTKWSRVASPGPQSSGSLNGVTVVSTNNIWAVGYYYNSSGIEQTLIEQWNGTKWSVIPSPNSGASSNDLTGVAAVSASNIWAVGYYFTSSNIQQTLIEHWNGSSWSIVPGQNPSSSNDSLNAVAAVSTSDVWAAGSYYTSNNVQQTLIEQWNGTKWNVVSSPSPGSLENELTGVTAISASNVWAVGFHNGNNTVQTLIEQWNGSQWSVVSSPNAALGGSFLNGIAASSANNVWAVGTSGETNGYYQTLIEQWNGSQWSIVTSSNPGSIGNLLNDVTVLSASDAWAVGIYSNTNYSSQSLVETWNGSAWSVVPSPNMGTPPTSGS